MKYVSIPVATSRRSVRRVFDANFDRGEKVFSPTIIMMMWMLAERFTVPHFTDPTPVPVENELLFGVIAPF